MIKKIIGGVIGLSMLGLVFYFQYVASSKSIENISNPKAILMGEHFSFSTLRPINHMNFPDTMAMEKIVILLTKSCPHCKNLMHVLDQNLIKHNGKNEIIAVFIDFNNDNIELLDFIKSEKLKMPLYGSRLNDVIKKVEFVPLFLYLDKQNFVKNAIAGGVMESGDLEELLTTLKSE